MIKKRNPCHSYSLGFSGLSTDAEADRAEVGGGGVATEPLPLGSGRLLRPSRVLYASVASVM